MSVSICFKTAVPFFPLLSCHFYVPYPPCFIVLLTVAFAILLDPRTAGAQQRYHTWTGAKARKSAEEEWTRDDQLEGLASRKGHRDLSGAVPHLRRR